MTDTNRNRHVSREVAHAIKTARVRATRHCGHCNHYAWDFMMDPVGLPGRGWHHPSCPRLPNHGRPLSPSVVSAQSHHGHLMTPSHWTTGAVDAVWVSSETVADAAKTFDSDLRNFVEEVSENPNFGKRGYMQAPAKEKATHSAFHTALSSITYDWWGVSDGDEQVWLDAARQGRKSAGPLWSGSDDDVLESIYKPEQLGFYKRLRIRTGQKLTTVGSAEFGAIMSFRERLKQVRAAYKGLGYNLTSPMSPDPATPHTWIDRAVTALQWTAGAVIVGGIGYMVWRATPAKPHAAEPAPLALATGSAP